MRIFNANITIFSLFTLFFGLFFFIYFFSFISASKVFAQSTLVDPNISLRCRELLDARGQKVSLKQKAQSMEQRVFELKKQLGPKKVSKQKKLAQIGRKIIIKLKILNLEISHLEEDIVRKGCPGIKF